MLSETHNRTLPVEPRPDGSFKTRLLEPVAHISKAAKEWLLEALNAPLRAAALVSVFGAVFTGRPITTALAALLAVLVYLDLKGHALCLRSSDSALHSKS